MTKTTLPALPAFTHVPAPYNGPSREEVMKLRSTHLVAALLTYYREPVMVVEGKMQYLFDETGRRYLDGLGGIVTVSVGHCHPHVIERVREQNDLLQHATTIYLHPNVARFGQMIADAMPAGSGLTTCYFTNTGSEANELACLMARLHSGNHDIIGLRNAYHGMTPTTMGLTAQHTWKYPVSQGIGVHHALNPNRYRGPWGYDDADAGAKYAADVEDLIRSSTPGQVAAFIAESIQGVGGVIEHPPGYLGRVYEVVRDAGGLTIADEVQTGFGRTGDHFWGFETHGVTPDFVTLAKGMGNGAPIGCVVTRPEIAASLSQRLHFNTFAGNPVSMAQGIATLEVMRKENIQARAKDIGGVLRAGLDELQSRHALVGDVRGQGLMLGVELVRDRATKEPANTETADVLECCKDMGLLIGKGGLFGNVLRIKPPMCLTREDCTFLCDVLDAAFTQAAGS